MLCSISTGKSGSRWLDRLRTAKGFSDDDVATDLENFLQNPNSPNPPKSDNPSPNPDPISCPNDSGDGQLFSIVSNVLHELFNFGDNCPNSKKAPRKQSNPRVCAVSNSSSNSGVGGVSDELAKRENEGEEDGRDGNFLGFSRTEVTVIDTSYESWKFEKLLYRKKNVWRVRDKKGKSECLGGKNKRKLGSGGGEHEGRKGKKRELQSNEVCLQNNKSEVHEKAPERVGKKKKHQDLNLENANSSFILIRSIPPTSKKNGPSISKKLSEVKTK